MTDKPDIMDLIDAYAEARHRCGCAAYNATTATARQLVVDYIASIGAGGVQALSAAPAGLVDAARMAIDVLDWLPTSDQTNALWQRQQPVLEALRAALAASPTPPAERQATSDPLDWSLPCDITAGGVTIGKGCTLRTVQTRLEVQAEANALLMRHLSREQAAPKDDGFYQAVNDMDGLYQAAPKAAPGDEGKALAALRYYKHECSGSEPSISVFHRMVEEALEAAPQQEAQEPTTVDQKTMELAESVGLIGPASRVGDLHAAIQRFHDLICVNATIKAAVMAADVIRGVATPERDYPPLPMQFACSGLFPVYSVDQMRAYVDADRAKIAAPQPAPAPLTPEQIEEICAELRNTVGCSNTTLARAIERAHGITQNGGQ